MSHLITRRRSVTNAPPTLSAPTVPAVSAPMIGEPTPLAEAADTASQVPVSSTSSVSVEPLSARRPHRRCRERSLLITFPRNPESRVRPPVQVGFFSF